MALGLSTTTHSLGTALTIYNPLYNVIKYDVDNGFFNIFSNGAVALKRSTRNENYALVPLLCSSPKLKLGGVVYQVREHHISIYEEIISEDKRYHYTAELLDERGELHSLHVYFNAQDKHVGKPVLKNSDNDILRLEGGDVNLLTQFAINHIAASFTKLKTVQEKLLDELSKQIISSIEETVLPERITLAALDTLLLKVSNIKNDAALFESFGGHKKMMLLAERLEENMQWEKAYFLQSQMAHNHAPERLSPIIDESSHEALRFEESTLRATNGSNASIIAKKERLQSEARALAELEASIDALSDWDAVFDSGVKMSAEEALEYSNAAQCALSNLLLTNSKASRCSNDVVRINTSLNKSKLCCVELLKEAFLFDNDLVIEQLKAYIQFLPPQLVASMITFNKAEKLDLLLSSGAFSPNQLLSTGPGNQPQSLLSFAFKKESVACFKVLLRYGASPLFIESNGLPLAHLVFSKRLSPFSPLLTEHYLKSGTRAFMGQLIMDLSSYLERSELLSQEERDEIYQAQTQYQLESDCFEKDDSRLAQPISSFLSKLYATIPAEMVPEIDALYHSPEVLGMQSVLNFWTMMVSQRLRGKYALRTNAETEQIMEEMISMPIAEILFSKEIILWLFSRQIKKLELNYKILEVSQGLDKLWPKKDTSKEIRKEIQDLQKMLVQFNEEYKVLDNAALSAESLYDDLSPMVQNNHIRSGMLQQMRLVIERQVSSQESLALKDEDEWRIPLFDETPDEATQLKQQNYAKRLQRLGFWVNDEDTQVVGMQPPVLSQLNANLGGSGKRPHSQ